MGGFTWLLVVSVLGCSIGYQIEEILTETVETIAEVSMEVPKEITKLKNKLHLHSLGAFHSFMEIHNKTYETQHEYKHRYRTYRKNMKKVYQLQASELGSAEYGATHLADLTEEEFKRDYLGFNKLADDPDIHWPPADIPDIPLPDSFDWREHGAVTKVKNQGMCGSCWAFSVTGNVEGQNAIKNGKLVSLSEQELVDCDKRDYGCNGGFMENAYETLLEIGGLESEEEYGYDGDDEACKFDRSRVVTKVSGGVEISQNETQMAQWLLQNGPISVGLNAFAMQFYMGGVSHPFSFMCGASGIDHGVLIVGFGVHTTKYLHRVQPYWLIKNSWGPSWGEQGYYKLFRGQGVCGINMAASSAIVEENTTTTSTTTSTTTTPTTTTTATTTTTTPTTTTTTPTTTTETTTPTTTTETTTQTTTTPTTTTQTTPAPATTTTVTDPDTIQPY